MSQSTLSDVKTGREIKQALFIAERTGCGHLVKDTLDLIDSGYEFY